LPALLAFAALLFLVAAGAWINEAISSSRDQRRFAPPGRLLEVGGCRVHVREQGGGSPSVVFEAGLAASSISWSHVQELVSEFASTVAYDRPGLGWSGDCHRPLTLPGMVTHLKQILSAAAIPAPYILVGHSFGALIIRAFAHQSPRDIAGLVLVDPVSINAWAPCSNENRSRLAYGARLSRRGAWLAKFGIVRLALTALAAGKRTFPRLIGQATSGRGNETLKRLVGEVTKLPPHLLPAVRSHWSAAKSFQSMAAHLECLPGAAQTAAEFDLTPEIPVIVLSAGTATDAELRERDAWTAGTTRGRHTQLPNSGHWLHLEYPEIVVGAIRELIAPI
jgi:pimeloyl-ACP methyl ester carboxylesterase